jgi:hypothetical protein
VCFEIFAKVRLFSRTLAVLNAYLPYQHVFSIQPLPLILLQDVIFLIPALSLSPDPVDPAYSKQPLPAILLLLCYPSWSAVLPPFSKSGKSSVNLQHETTDQCR